MQFFSGNFRKTAANFLRNYFANIVQQKRASESWKMIKKLLNCSLLQQPTTAGYTV